MYGISTRTQSIARALSVGRLMTKVTKESLAERIQHLEDLGSMISLNEEYQLAAYRMLMRALENGPIVFMGVFQDGRGVAYYHTAKAANKDGADEIIPLYGDVIDD